MLQPLQSDRWRIPKSRYASNSTYISTDSRLRPEYFDPNLVIDKDIKRTLMEGGMDDLLATHFAHLFIRDPLVIFSEDLRELDLSKTDHFENIQSTNWQHMRFKPPPADSTIGWRVEFRPMEIQMSDFENAAFTVFVVLVTRAILSFNLNFYIPIRRVDENMETAHARDAVLERRFHFRKNPFPAFRASRNANSNGAGSNRASAINSPVTSRPATPMGPVEEEYRLMSVNEIVNGTAYARSASAGSDDADEGDADDFPGLIPIVESYLDSVNVDVATRCELETYLSLIRRRASGELCTAARWIRRFVAGHGSYARDSVVGDDIVRDLVGAVIAIGEREQKGTGFTGLDVPDFASFLGKFRGGC